MPKLKFCGIRSKLDLLYCKKVGVDFVGIHLGNEGEVEPERIELLRYAKSIGLRVVMVTKLTDKDVLLRCIREGSPWAVQLHFDGDWELAIAIKEMQAARLFGVVTDKSDLSKKPMDMYDMLIYDRDYLGGTGQKNELKLLPQLKPYAQRLLIAGGVNPEVIRAFAESKDIAGFDIQSFLRQRDKRLSFRKCQQVLFAAGRYARGRISVSFTDYDVVQGLERYPYDLDAVYEYHMDLFLEDESRRALDMERLAQLQSYPLSVHFIGGSEQEISDFFASELGSDKFENVQSAVLLDRQGSWHTANTIRAWYYRDPEPNWSRRLTVIGSDDDNPEKLSQVVSVIKRARYDELWLDRKLSVDKLSFYATHVAPGFNVVLGHHLHVGNVTFDLVQEMLRPT